MSARYILYFRLAMQHIRVISDSQNYCQVNGSASKPVGQRLQADQSLASIFAVCGKRTGGAGHIGHHAIRASAGAGWEVAAPGNLTKATIEQPRSAGDHMSAPTSGQSARAG